MAKQLSIGDCSVVSISGAQNCVVGIPAAETDDGIPHVFVWGSVGAGCPERLYHSRWLDLGSVPATAVPDEIEHVLARHQDAIVERLAAYQGTKWTGSNHVGVWSPDHDPYAEPDELARDLQGVATYWDASDWYAPVTIAQVATCDSLEEQIDHETTEAVLNDGHLDWDDVERWLLDAARHWLDTHELDDDESESESDEQAALRARLTGWLVSV